MAELNKTITMVLPTMVFKVEQELLAGARDYLCSHGYELLTVVGGYLPGPNDANNIRNWIYEFLPDHTTDGVIFYGGGIGYSAGNDATEQLVGLFKHLPVINIGSALDSVPSVLADNREGICNVVKHLISKQGYSKLGFLRGPVANEEANARFNAFCDTLEKHNVPFNPEWILQGDFVRSTGRSIAKGLVESGKPLPEVMVCANDLSAHGFIEGLTDCGLAVPTDMAVTGFDNFEYAEAMEPALTTVGYPAYAMGQAAAKGLLAKISGKQLDDTKDIPSKAIIRESCGAKIAHHKVKESIYLKQRRAQILVRDMHAQRLTFDQQLYQHTNLKLLFDQAAQNLDSAGIHQLYLCLFDDDDSSDAKLQHQVVDGEVIPLAEHQKSIVTDQLLPEHIGQRWRIPSRNDTIWLVHPLAFEHMVFGYLVAEVNVLVCEFGEALGIQLSQAINRQKMLFESIERQHELECSLEALKNAHLKLDKAEKVASLGRLVAGIGHELNTPLGAGITMASMLVEETQSLTNQLLQAQLSKKRLNQSLTRAHDAAESILRSLERASSLVDIFKSNSFEKEDSRWQSLTIWEVIQSSYFRIKDDLELELELDVQCDKALILECDVDALSSALIHLLYNSAHHAYPGHKHGKVNISVSHKGNNLVIKYQDFGLGMDKAALPRVFEPFYTTQRSTGHTGLGLYLVYNLVSLRLHGVITVSSRKQGGTQFTIEVPTRK
ncbi:hypothetical protein EZV61_16185 [Corallincola luteus]|uniref:histidine kinase n=1 Tax=Corallincola luteus TaxID=1775177 RepID=A0ABY2AHT3_9GAMM|nr:sensor histidine kinase [Corallincola luteus]TCI01806.1 hypothetical protein EZV61_16185 [Corallincola luteus]